MVSASPLFAGSNQPARRGLDIRDVMIDGGRVPVETRDMLATPFCVLVRFTRADIDVRRNVLVVAPLSGHFALLLRDLVIGLIPWFRVHITDWLNIRHVAINEGPFDLETNIATVLGMVKRLGSGLTVIALCQSGVPTVAAAAALATAERTQAPRRLVLMAAPINPLANPTGVVRLLRAHPLEWMEHTLIEAVSDEFAGRGRSVYPARLQLSALEVHLVRRILEGSELARKVIADDGCDPSRFPFLDAYTSIMDLDAQFFLENTKSLFHDCELQAGTLRYAGDAIEPQAIRHTDLMTIEGEWDDIVAPGQTSAAHDLCSSLPGHARRRLVVPRCGHFSLFHGERWRREILPEFLRFCGLLPA